MKSSPANNGPQNSPQLLVNLGSCRTPHGIKGGMSWKLFNEESVVLKKGQKVLCKPLSSQSSLPKEGVWFVLKSISLGHKTMATFEGVEDRNQVEAMIPFSLEVDRRDFPKLQKTNQYYLNDLIHLKVYQDQDPAKTIIGHVQSFYENGAQVILVIQEKSGECIELPFVSAYFPQVDLAQRLMSMVRPEYLEATAEEE